jgi:hypothetical protein
MPPASSVRLGHPQKCLQPRVSGRVVHCVQVCNADIQDTVRRQCGLRIGSDVECHAMIKLRFRGTWQEQAGVWA